MIAAFRDSWMSGFRISLVVAGLVLLVAAVIANRFIPGRAWPHGKSPRQGAWTSRPRSNWQGEALARWRT